jgi:tetratricopeptide (TPR) repeat protein
VSPRLGLVLVLLLVWGRSPVAIAQRARAATPSPADKTDKADRADKADKEQAQLHFSRGEKLFAIGEFADALDEYRSAYEAFPAPEFLFNIAQCHRNLGNYDEAIFSFRRFLELDPDAQNRPAVEALIAELEAKKQERDSHKLIPRAGAEPHRPPPPPPPGRPFYKSWWFWTTVSVVVVGSGAGAYWYTTRDRGGLPSTDLGNFPFPP